VSATEVRNEATLAVRQGPLLGPVLSRVVGMLAARAQCPIDRLDDALLVADAVAAHAPAFTRDGPVRVTVRAHDGGLELSVTGLGAGGADGLLSAADLPGVGNVLRQVADDVTTEGDGADERLVVRLGFAT
jgi:serine/threonine-protein kinase RsbW